MYDRNVIKRVVRLVLDQYTLPLDGYHGPAHWARVMLNGHAIIDATRSMNAGWDIGPCNGDSYGVRKQIVSLFAVLHDACRLNEDRDEHHGLRAGEFAAKLWQWGQLGPLTSDQFTSLRVAIDLHNDGHTTRDKMIAACWDSDRLDLDRVGIKPAEQMLWTQDSRLIDSCRRRALDHSVPRFVFEQWGLTLQSRHADTLFCEGR